MAAHLAAAYANLNAPVVGRLLSTRSATSSITSRGAASAPFACASARPRHDSMISAALNGRGPGDALKPCDVNIGHDTSCLPLRLLQPGLWLSPKAIRPPDMLPKGPQTKPIARGCGPEL